MVQTGHIPPLSHRIPPHHPFSPAPPAGDVEALLDAYDRERRTLPAPVILWEWGWTKSAETWNGRIAMLALLCVVLLEATTGQSIFARMLMLE